MRPEHLPAPTGTASPSRAVIAAIQGGAVTIDEVARRARLDPQIASTALQRLVASGHLASQALSLGCPPGGCGGCPSGSATGCTVDGSPARNGRGPVLITLASHPADAAKGLAQAR